MSLTKLESIELARQHYDNLVKNIGPEAIKDEVRKFFEVVPRAKAIRWTQGTPSWNDGDACHFSASEPQVSDNYVLDEDGSFEEVLFDMTDEEEKSLVDLCNSFSANEDLLETIFGDDKEITIVNDDKLTLLSTYWNCGY